MFRRRLGADLVIGILANASKIPWVRIYNGLMRTTPQARVSGFRLESHTTGCARIGHDTATRGAPFRKSHRHVTATMRQGLTSLIDNGIGVFPLGTQGLLMDHGAL